MVKSEDILDAGNSYTLGIIGMLSLYLSNSYTKKNALIDIEGIGGIVILYKEKLVSIREGILIIKWQLESLLVTKFLILQLQSVNIPLHSLIN